MGDASKAARELGWRPTVNFEELIRIMVEADLADLQANNKLQDPSAGELEYQRAAR